MMRHAVRLNSIDELAITKLDVLDSFETVKVCVAYEAGGKRYDNMPWHQSVLYEVTPVYVELPGWNTETTGIAAEGGTAKCRPRLRRLPGGPGRRAGHFCRRRPGREQIVRLG